MNKKTSILLILPISLLASIVFTAADTNVASSSSVALENKPSHQQDVIHNTSLLIDQAVKDDLEKAELKPNPVIDDATFLRRSYIQIIGRIPTHSEATRFLADKSLTKRADLIDALVYSPGYNSTMFNYWADMLRLHTNSDQHGLGWHVWIRDAVNNNMPYDKFVNSMLSAKGHTSENPAVGYYLRDRNMLLDNVSNSVQVFLGTQIGCAQCHDHPFEDWTQKQYYSLAAFAGNLDYKSSSANMKIRETVKHIAKTEGVNIDEDKMKAQAKNKTKGKNRKKNQNNVAKYKKHYRDLRTLFKQFGRNETTVNNSKVLKLPEDYQYNDGKPGEIVKPSVLFGSMPHPAPGEDRLTTFANWVTSPENPQFTKNIANRLWKRAFGYALAEPIDNWTDRTKVSHPEALALVEKILRSNNYNTRETLRILYHTQLFQREVGTIEVVQGSAYNFQGPILQRLSAEQVHDSLATLEKGNIDANYNFTLKHSWKAYQVSIKTLLTASPQTVIQLDKLADDTEKQLLSLKKETRRLKAERDKATGEGDPAKAAKIQAQMRALYAKLKGIQNKAKKKAKDNANPAVAEMASMMTMGKTRSRSKGIMRASEVPAPSKKGNLLQQFGASDRQIPDGSSTFASIPQTLTLLNGREVGSVTDKKGLLPQLIAKAKTNEEKLDVLFLSIYSTYPTEREKSKYTAYMSDFKKTQILAKAMLNSKRFLFVR